MEQSQRHVTARLGPSPEGIAVAARLLHQGELVAFPTETVYGLGADARNDHAIAAIYAAKGRPSFNPLIVHVTSLAQAEELAVFSEPSRRLAAAFWPGPLTLVLPIRAGAALSPLLSAGLASVALRVPAHPVAQALLAAFGGPIAAPSANPSGQMSPTTAAHVLAGLDDKIGAVVDGGPCAVGLESTIIGFAPDPTLLRPGGIAREDIESLLGKPLTERTKAPLPNAPGQLDSHYAPNARLRMNATTRGTGEALLGFGSVAGDLNLSVAGDLVEAAANLFAMLHRLDAAQPIGIAVAPVPEIGLGLAINDRLRRAAAPRP